MKEYFTSIEDGLYEVFVFDAEDQKTPYWRLFNRDQLYKQAVKDKDITIINYQSAIHENKRIMEEKQMETLKEIKEALVKIPDEVLDNCKFALGENSDDIVSLVVLDEDYSNIFEKYQDLEKINKLIQNIKKAQEILDTQDREAELLSENLQQEDGLTDTYFDK